MDLRHLRYFVAVAEEGHFGRAAARLHIVQPALCMQIKALEEEVGGPLLTRTSRKVALTEAGQLLLPEAYRTLAQAERTLKTVQRSVRGETGTVRVGFAGYGALTGQLMNNLTEYRQRYPEVDVQLNEVPPHEQPAAILSGKLDVGYWPRLTQTLDPALTTEAIGEWPMMVAMSVNHPVAEHKKISQAHIANNPLILYAGPESEYGPLSAVEHFIALQPPTIHRVASTLAVLSLAAAGVGLAPVPAPIQQVSLPNLTYRPLDGDNMMSTLMLLSRASETSGAVNAFVALARQAGN